MKISLLFLFFFTLVQHGMLQQHGEVVQVACNSTHRGYFVSDVPNDNWLPCSRSMDPCGNTCKNQVGRLATVLFANRNGDTIRIQPGGWTPRGEFVRDLGTETCTTLRLPGAMTLVDGQCLSKPGEICIFDKVYLNFDNLPTSTQGRSCSVHIEMGLKNLFPNEVTLNPSVRIPILQPGEWAVLATLLSINSLWLFLLTVGCLANQRTGKVITVLGDKQYSYIPTNDGFQFRFPIKPVCARAKLRISSGVAVFMITWKDKQEGNDLYNEYMIPLAREVDATDGESFVVTMRRPRLGFWCWVYCFNYEVPVGGCGSIVMPNEKV